MTQSNEKVSSTNKKVKGIPLRFFLIFNSFFAFIMVYANKVILSMAIVAMFSEFHSDLSLTAASYDSAASFQRTNISNISSASFAALHSGLVSDNNQEPNSNLRNVPVLIASSNQLPGIAKQKVNQVSYNSSTYHKTKAKVLGAFFWGYIVTQVPAGRLAERFGAKWLLGISMFLCSLMSLVIPIATLSENDFKSSRNSLIKGTHNFMWSLLGDAWALQLLRMAQGVCAGVAHPCMHALITRWTPKNERSLTTAFIYSGSQIGTVFIMPVTGYLIANPIMGQTWESSFYLLGVLGTVWFVLWCIFVYDTPDKHPFISKEELQKLKIGIGDEISHDNHNIPWGKVFTSWPVYALIFAHFGQNFGYFMLLTELPTYLSKSLGYDIQSNSQISCLPYLVQAITSWISSYISDRIVKSDKYPLSWVRKGFNTIGFFGPAICFVVIAIAGQSKTIVVLSLIFSLGLNGFAMSGFHVTHVDMAPDFAGTLMGITNGISNFNGVIAPFIVTALTDKNGHTEWYGVFLIACAVYVITNIIYCWFGTSKLQSWARSTTDRDLVNTVYVCDMTNSGMKKDAYLLSDIKTNIKTNINSTTKSELLNTKH